MQPQPPTTLAPLGGISLAPAKAGPLRYIYHYDVTNGHSVYDAVTNKVVGSYGSANEAMNATDQFNRDATQPNPYDPAVPAVAPTPAAATQPGMLERQSVFAVPAPAKKGSLIKAGGTGQQRQLTPQELAQWEARSGDIHRPALIGDKEGVVNARAMAQPGVAEAVAKLNQSLPVMAQGTVAGTVADTTQQQPAPEEIASWEMQHMPPYQWSDATRAYYAATTQAATQPAAQPAATLQQGPPASIAPMPQPVPLAPAPGVSGDGVIPIATQPTQPTRAATPNFMTPKIQPYMEESHRLMSKAQAADLSGKPNEAKALTQAALQKSKAAVGATLASTEFKNFKQETGTAYRNWIDGLSQKELASYGLDSVAMAMDRQDNHALEVAKLEAQSRYWAGLLANEELNRDAAKSTPFSLAMSILKDVPWSSFKNKDGQYDSNSEAAYFKSNNQATAARDIMASAFGMPGAPATQWKTGPLFATIMDSILGRQNNYGAMYMTKQPAANAAPAASAQASEYLRSLASGRK